MNFNGCPRLSLLPLVLAAFVLPARAQILNGAYQSQLVTWIDQGPLTFTSLFTKVAGDGQNALDFHTAVDAKGPTVSLFDVTPFDPCDGLFDLPDQIIGGVNPSSLDSSNTWHLALAHQKKNAFIFNLTDDKIQRENKRGLAGLFQTYNSSFYGPTFGLGDIVTDFGLEHGLAAHNSYGETFAQDILRIDHADLFKISRLEVYGVALCPSSSQIPEPAAWGALAAAVLLAATVLLRRKGRPVPVLAA